MERQQSGGRVTDLAGGPLEFSFSAGAVSRSHAVVAAAPALHDQLCAALASTEPAG